MSGFHVVVLSCGSLGARVANEVVRLDGISLVTLVESPYRQKRRSLPGTLRHTYQMEGIPGLFEVARRRMGFDGGDSRENGAVVELNPAVGRITVTDFHSPVCMQTLCGLHADLGVLAGTYILRDTVFALPRYGSINLHTGKLPEYRGSAPAFWEMYNGEPEVGITIHQVESELDAGGVYQQERFPLDLAPRMDPMSYIARYREETLVPNGIRMVTSTVAMIADGNAVCVPQDSARARTYRMPNYNAIKELRRRVRARRKSAEGDAR